MWRKKKIWLLGALLLLSLSALLHFFSYGSSWSLFSKELLFFGRSLYLHPLSSDNVASTKGNNEFWSREGHNKSHQASSPAIIMKGICYIYLIGIQNQGHRVFYFLCISTFRSEVTSLGSSGSAVTVIRPNMKQQIWLYQFFCRAREHIFMCILDNIILWLISWCHKNGTHFFMVRFWVSTLIWCWVSFPSPALEHNLYCTNMCLVPPIPHLPHFYFSPVGCVIWHTLLVRSI